LGFCQRYEGVFIVILNAWIAHCDVSIPYDLAMLLPMASSVDGCVVQFAFVHCRPRKVSAVCFGDFNIPRRKNSKLWSRILNSLKAGV